MVLRYLFMVELKNYNPVTIPVFVPVSIQPELKICAVQIESSEA